MTEAAERSGLLSLLAWWREAGVTDALDETALDWTARPDAIPGADFVWPDRLADPPAPTGPLPATRPGPPEVRRPLASAPTSERPTPDRPAPRPSPARQPPDAPAGAPTARREAPVVGAARAAARKATSLEALEALLREFDGCPLKATAKSLCFYRGAPNARIMVIGEAPGRDEDIAGKPFVGRAGQLLDRMLAAIGLSEADVHITNIVYWRPPGNRTPTPEEAEACRPFLERQIELVAPEIVLTLGGPAAKAILDTTDGILRLRGKWRDLTIASRPLRVLPTLHPAYLLRQPDAKRDVWRDLLSLRQTLDRTLDGTLEPSARS